jgi:hypothetical protein
MTDQGEVYQRESRNEIAMKILPVLRANLKD